ncbi:50S ribosomal protein L9 [Eubacterium sp. AB3007]|jgi:large subunit ribosomal protein L9|uniref:50S ribosomal protein L9 n=1 Tax=Eubacterium sp. AB3007 TaxID=1392487 RepID=UPI0004892369|nr:50S ribosomal protein L9 [Eubacterium sp. AB3007]
MIVILKRDVKGTGKAGEVVKVSDGYARNMLIPKGYAIEATKGNINTLEKVKAKQAEEEAAAKAAAEELAEKIEKIDVTILTKAGTGGRLFGSITTKEISAELERQHGIKIDKKKMSLESPIKALGVFNVPIKLYSGVNAELTVKVVD